MGQTIPILSLLTSIAGVGTSVAQGEDARRGASRSLRQQQSAQEEAAARARSNQRQSAQELRRNRQRRPRLDTTLGDAAGARGGATTLTGAGGVPRSTLSLGGASSLGG